MERLGGAISCCRRMLDAGYLSQAEYQATVATEIKVVGERRTQTQAPYFVRYINRELQQKLGFEANFVYGGGLKVYTTLDLDIQKAAEQAIEQWVDAGETDSRGLTQPQAAIVTGHTSPGHILAWVGGRQAECLRPRQCRAKATGLGLQTFCLCNGYRKPQIYARDHQSGRADDVPSTHRADLFTGQQRQYLCRTGHLAQPSNVRSTWWPPN